MSSVLDFLDQARKSREADAVYLSDVTGVDTGTESMVQQNQGVDADINTIMRRFGVTNAVELRADAAQGIYGDFSGITDYASARAMLEDADARFMQLPPEVRELFGNDPGRMVRAAQSMSEEDFLAALDVVPGYGSVPAPGVAASPEPVPPG